jgi:multidrug efflux pump subunit AcrA (membrane-fusion protein)
MKELLDDLRIDERRRIPAPARVSGEPSRSRRRYRLAALLLAPIGLGSWFLATTHHAPVEVATVTVPTGLAAAGAGALSSGGYVKAAWTIQVVPRVSGRIVVISAKEGDLLAAGDTVAVLESRDLEHDAAEARAAMEMARATRDNLAAGSRPQEVEAARARLQAAAAELEAAERELGRSKELWSAGGIPAQTLDRAETEYRVRASGLEAARQSLALVEAGPSAEARRAATAAAAMAQARWARATSRLADTRVLAPVAGRVIRVFREVGDFVSAETPYIEGGDTLAAGTPLLTLADAGPQEATTDITETDISQVTLGGEVEVTPNAFPSMVVRGSVTRLAARADRNKGTVQVRVTLRESPTVLPHDLGVKVTFLHPGADGRAAEGGTVLPAMAIAEKDGNRFVYVAADGRARLRDVDVGGRSRDGIVVTRGLSTGERVIVSNLDQLEDGKPVTPR